MKLSAKTSIKFLLTLLTISSLQVGCSSGDSKLEKQNAALEAAVGVYSLVLPDVATFTDEAGVATCSAMTVNLSRGPSTLNIDEVNYTCTGITTTDFRPLTLTLVESNLKIGNKTVGSMNNDGFTVTINTDYKISLVYDSAKENHVFVLSNKLNNKTYKLDGDLTKQ